MATSLRNPERVIDFTPSGRRHAEHIVSRHRMIERFLTDVVGVPWDDVHEEAEQLEHAMTPRFEAYVRSTVGDAATCPHGHPIRVGERIDGVPLADCSEGAKVTVLRFENEAEDLLHYLKRAGLEPGLKGEVGENDGGVRDREDRPARGHGHHQRRGDGVGTGHSLAAAADCAARAVGAGPGALRALGASSRLRRARRRPARRWGRLRRRC